MARNDQREMIAQFVDHLSRLGPGDRASLRRLNSSEPEAGYPVFYSALPWNAPRWAEDSLMTVAMLYGYHGKHGDDAKDFAAAYRSLGAGDAADRRFEIILKAKEQLASRLLSAVRMLRDTRLDYVQLALDVLDWDSPWGHVQKQWARTFWQATREESSK